MRPRRRAGVLSQRADDTLILLDPESGEYYSLDETGARIWDLCSGTRTVPEIVARVCAEYDAPAATVEADTRELLDELASERLLEIRDAVQAAP